MSSFLSSLDRRGVVAVLLAMTVLLLFGLSARSAAAAGIVVNSNADIVGNDGVCTLREAITNANSDSDTTGGDCAAGSGSDTITFAADYTITLIGSQFPAVTTEMTITGNGATNTVIQANAFPNVANYRVFEVGGTGNLTLDGVTVQHGRCVGACSPSANDGGGILNNGTLTVSNSTLSRNQASIGGGGIWNNGTLTVSNSALSRNTAGGGGGIWNSGTLTVTNSTFFDHTADDGSGIWNSGTLTVTNSTLFSNFAGGGGGLWNSGTTTVTNSTLSRNYAFNGGGMWNDGTLAVTNSTLFGNMAEVNGGGLYSNTGTVTLSRSVVSGNSARDYYNFYELSGYEVYKAGGTITANAYNVFGHSGVEDYYAFVGFFPGPTDFNAAYWGGRVALERILDTTLADNGGPTWTHALVPGSPAIDFGPTTGCAAAPVNGVDQRGYDRNIDGNGAASASECDAGAFEFGHQPAFCTGFPMSAGTEAELNQAVTCYNLLVVPGQYTINLTADIALTAGIVPINHPVAGFELFLDGQGFAVDGQGKPDLRPFEIKADSDAIFNDITIMGGNFPGDGGGILNYGTLIVSNSTVSGNTGVDGGGIYNFFGTLSVTNSTLSGNVAGSDGGGIFNYGATLSVTNSTLSGNETGSDGGEGGGILHDGGTLTVTRSVVSGNSALVGDEVFNRGGAINADTFNVFGHAGQTDATAFVGFAPGLSDFNATTNGTPTALAAILDTTLADNGGPTETHALVAGSPAIDLAGACGLATDQRGVPRPQGTACDTGAFEVAETFCEAGYYFGGLYCLPADPGNFVPGPGATEQTECSPGSWQDQSGADSCKLADPGFFVPGFGATEQLACEPGFTSEAGATECTAIPPASACPVDPADGTVGAELTTLYGAGMGSPTRTKMMAKVTIPNAADVTDLYGQMAAKAFNGVRYVRFIFGDKSFEQVQPETDLGAKGAISWWGADLTAGFQLQAKPFVKGRWFLEKGAKKMKLPRAIVVYATHTTGTDYANAWTTFTAADNFVAGTPGFDQTNTNFLPIPETQATTDITVQIAVTDVNRDPRTFDVTVTAGNVSETVTLTGPTNKKSELLNLFTVTLQDAPAGVDEVEILLETAAGSGDSAALLGAAASYACEESAR